MPVIKRSLLQRLLRKIHREKKRIVFTNGVFDLLHRGHIEYLSKANGLGDVLIVGVNSDRSVRRLKGPNRPIQSESDRAVIVSSLRSVDYVVLFGEDSPEKLITQVRPDVLVKGADYSLDEIVGRDFVESYGGKVVRVRLTRGRSSSRLARKLFS